MPYYRNTATSLLLTSHQHKSLRQKAEGSNLWSRDRIARKRGCPQTGKTGRGEHTESTTAQCKQHQNNWAGTANGQWQKRERKRSGTGSQSSTTAAHGHHPASLRLWRTRREGCPCTRVAIAMSGIRLGTGRKTLATPGARIRLRPFGKLPSRTSLRQAQYKQGKQNRTFGNVIADKQQRADGGTSA